MNFLPSFSAWQFAVAGAVCAAGPIIIHLLNRRRFRVVHWAAMDFLREALQRSRRILQIRDLLLLLLRTVAVLFVGLALAQPFLSRSDESYDGSKPLHSVLVIDNSLSMGYQSLDGTLLDRAKTRAKQYVDKLPTDSRVSVIPLCGSRFGYSPDAYTKEDAAQAVDRIEVVDRPASVQQAVNEAKKACETGPTLGKRVVLFSDQQAVNWKDLSGDDPFVGLPSLQVVDISAPQWENTWISDLRVQDGLADVETPATFIVELRHEGAMPRQDVQVTLFVEDVEVASKSVTLEPGPGAREVSFEYAFNAYRPEPDRPLAVPVRATLTPDRLPADDERHLVVPVVAALPVVFVDQYADNEEDPARNRLGETRHLRKLLAPVTSRTESPLQLVRVRHIKLDDLEQHALEDARLVVVAGVADPGAKVTLLRDYVVQGGQLVIAAGGEYDPALNSGFDPAKWTESAWLDGGGILPVALKNEYLGGTPRELADRLKAFFISYESVQTHAYFKLAGADDDQLRDLYAEPFFFKAVQADLGEETLRAWHEAEVQRLEDESRLMSDLAAHRREGKKNGANGSKPGNGKPEAGDDTDERLRQARPRWLLWSGPGPVMDEELPQEPEARARRLSQLAERARPKVLARFDDAAQTPFLVERHIGRGRALLVTTSVLADWNTLPKTNTMLIFDRILRAMIEATLPERNFAPQDRIALPLPTAEREIAVSLRRPGPAAAPEILDTGFIAKEQLGFTVPRPLARGLYRVVAVRTAVKGSRTANETAWDLPLAVNGPATESELTPLSRDEFESRITSPQVRWVAAGEEISLAGSQIRGQDSWWWLLLAVLLLLLLELTLLAAPLWRTKRPVLQQAPV